MAYDTSGRCACGDGATEVPTETICLSCGEALSFHLYLHPHSLPTRYKHATCSGFMGPRFYPGAEPEDTAGLIARDAEGGEPPPGPQPYLELNPQGLTATFNSTSAHGALGPNSVYVSLDRGKDHAGGWMTPSQAMELAEAIIEAAVRAEES